MKRALARTHGDRRSTAWQISILLLMLIGTDASAQTPSRVRPRIDAQASERIDAIFLQGREERAPGCSVSATLGGATLISRGYGFADLEHNIANTPDTTFNIGSVSKQFTAFAVQLLVEEGKLSLDDDIRTYLPELHDFGRIITVRHLVHHTSGLRDALILLYLAGWRYDDAVTRQDVFDMIWRQRELNAAPGEEWSYSNTNYMLLAEIVKRVSGMPLPEFAQQRIFDPLGMSDTRLLDNYGAFMGNRARSYVTNGGEIGHAPVLMRGATDGGGYRAFAASDSVIGSANIVTTVEDLQRWSRNFDDARVGGRRVMARMREVGKLNNGRRTDYASGLSVGSYRGTATIEHGGILSGYRSHLMRFPDLGFSIAVLCNSIDLNATSLAHRVADVLIGDRLGAGAPAAAAVAEAPPAEIQIDRSVLAAYVGAYWFAPNAKSTVSLEGDSLMLQIADQPAQPVFAVSEREFYIPRQNGARLIFSPADETGRSHQLRLVQGGDEQSAYRLSPLPPAQIGAYPGSYYSAELDTLYTVIEHDGLLSARYRRGEIQLVRTGPAAYATLFALDIQCRSGNRCTPFGFLEFQCGDGQRCDSFLLTNERVRNLRFERVNLQPLSAR